MTADSGAGSLRDCPYCEDGELEPLEDMGAVHQCTNAGACPATFVAVLGGEPSAN